LLSGLWQAGLPDMGPIDSQPDGAAALLPTSAGQAPSITIDAVILS
jgi:hypothetical protein